MKKKIFVSLWGIIWLTSVLGCALLPKTDLIRSAGEGDIAGVQSLIKNGADINEADRSGQTPLMYAIRKNRTSTAKAIIDLGANINLQDKNAYSALSYAISCGNPEMVDVLMDKGADLNVRDYYGNSYLHLAASYNQSEIVKELLKQLKINDKNSYGDTPLHVALSHRNYEVAKLLVDCGADVNAINRDGATPLHYVVMYGYVSRSRKFVRDHLPVKSDKLTSQQIIESILSKNPDVSVKDSSGYTPFLLAVYYNDKEMLAVLRRHMDPLALKRDEAEIKIMTVEDVRYRIISQTELSERIKSETVFRVRPVDYSAIKFAELGFSREEDWNAEKAGGPQIFITSCVKMFDQSGVKNKKIYVLNQNEIVNNGIIVEVAVKNIILYWNFYTKISDVYLCDVIFKDAQNGETLFSAFVKVTSCGKNRGELGSGHYPGAGPTFRVNPGDAGWEGTFSGRLYIAAENMAWIVTKIITDGKIDESG